MTSQRESYGRMPTMWRVRKVNVPPSVIKVVVFRHGEVASHGAVLEALTSDADLRAALTDTLAGLPFEAFYWEMPPFSSERWDDDFDSAVIDAPELSERPADASAFDGHLSGAPEGDMSVTFDNLGGDATLVVPTARADHQVYRHLAAFLRGAPRDQVDALLEAVGRAASSRVGEAPLWISTAGLGVPWLHVRLDTRPKYYKFAGFRDANIKRWPGDR